MSSFPFRPIEKKTLTLWSGTYIYRLYEGVPGPPGDLYGGKRSFQAVSNKSNQCISKFELKLALRYLKGLCHREFHIIIFFWLKLSKKYY